MATFTGTDGDDQATGAYDRVYALGGNDYVSIHWIGPVYLDGGDGDDEISTNGDSWGEFFGGAGGDWIGGGQTEFVDSIVGGFGDDVVFGDVGNFYRNGGADLIDGGDGRDALSGDAGDDTIYGGEGDESGPDITAGSFGFRYAPGLFGGEGNDWLDGGAGHDLLHGGEHNDTLIGGSGNDTMIGGDRNDTFVVDSPGDVVLDALPGEFSSGTDRVISSVNWTLGARIEHLILTGGALRGRGNETSNKLVGNALGNILDGREGFDTLSGGWGNDRLSGGEGYDRLSGGSGHDTLIGGTGRDVMSGGSGRDVFVFDDRHTGIWVNGLSPTADYITDFSARAGDRINLRPVDANAHVVGDQAFEFIGMASFTRVGQVRYEKDASYTYIYFNTNADGFPEGAIKLKGSFDLSPSWFML